LINPAGTRDVKFHTLLWLFAVFAIAVFAALNWAAFVTPTELSLGFIAVRVPLGLVMLVLMALLTALFLVSVVYLQTSALLDTRRQSREVQAHRELADKAEASRFTELRAFLEVELKKQASLGADSKADVLARIDQLDRDFHSFMEHSGNTLAAYIGELEDRLETQGDPAAGRPAP
jgi:uncharacterized integral membrane protein